MGLTFLMFNSMPGLCSSYGRFYGLHYVVHLWLELCD
jgi:hypothetical protein